MQSQDVSRFAFPPKSLLFLADGTLLTMMSRPFLHGARSFPASLPPPDNDSTLTGPGLDLYDLI